MDIAGDGRGKSRIQVRIVATIHTISRVLACRLRADGDDFKRLTLILGVALVVRAAWVLAFQPSPESDPAEYDRLAWGLAQGHGYVNEDGAPTAFRPVGYPAFLAAIYVVFGHSFLAAGLANALLGTLSVALTYRLAREFLSSRLSLTAAGAVALLPSHIMSFTASLWTETLHTALVLGMLIAVCHLVRHPTRKNAALLGFVLGVSVYVRSILMLFPIAIALLLAIRGGAKKGTAVTLAGIALLASLLTISPWTVRNYLAMDEFILTSTNAGKIFYMANGPGATGEYRDLPEGVFSDLSEIDAYRDGIRLGFQNIVNDPVGQIRILPNKFFHLWASDRYNMGPGILPESYRGFIPILWVVAQGYWTLIVIGAALAAVTRPIRGYWLTSPAAILPLTLFYWTAFHMIFNGEGRYHAQMIPVVIIIAAHLPAPGRDWRAWLPDRWR